MISSTSSETTITVYKQSFWADINNVIEKCLIYRFDSEVHSMQLECCIGV